MIKKDDLVLITKGSRTGLTAKVLQVFDTNNIKAKIVTDGPFKNQIL